MAVSERSHAGAWRRPDVRIGAVVAIALAAAFVAWLVLRSHDSHSASTSRTQTAEAIAPVAASQERLRELSTELGRPIYWAGPRTGATYELTRTDQDRIFVRYLPDEVPVGTKRAQYTIVGTYPVANAYGVLTSLSKKNGEVSFSAPNGGLAVYSTARPTNVYLAYPNSDQQIEVFDPSGAKARALISSRHIVPVS